MEELYESETYYDLQSEMYYNKYGREPTEGQLEHFINNKD